MTEPLPAVNANWASASMQEKRSWIDNGPGSRVVHERALRLTNLGRAGSSANEDVRQHMKSLEVDWRGPASDAAQATMGAVGARADATSSLASNGTRQLDDYGESFSNMARQIVYDDPEKGGWLGFTRSDGWQAAFGALDSRLSYDQANQQNSVQADHALTVHAANTTDVASRFATDAGPGTRWPGDVPPGAGPGNGAGASSTGGAAPGGAGAGVGGGAWGGGGSGPPVTSPARFEPPLSQGAVPAPGAAPSSVPGTPGAPPPGASSAGVPPPGTALPRVVPPGVGSPSARPSVGQAGNPPWWRQQPNVPRTDPGVSGADRAARFQDSLRNRQIPLPSSAGGGSGVGVPGGGPYGRGGTGGWGAPGSRGGAGTWGGTGGWGGSGGGSGASAWGGAGGGSGAGGWRGVTGSNPGSSGPLSEGGGTGSRGGAGARPGSGEGQGPGPAGGRAGERGAGGYGPMMGGAGAGSGGDQEHRNRYVVYSDEAFRVDDLPYTDPVIGPEDDDDRR